MSAGTAMYDAMESDDPDVTFSLAWDEIAARLPPLEGEPLRIDDVVKLSDPRRLLTATRSYLSREEPIPYGYSDLEGGEEAPATWEDPAPPGHHE